MALIPKSRPPIAWSWWERLRVFVGLGVCGALLISAYELLIADIPGERAFSRGSGGGAPLWPTIALWAVMWPLTGLAAAVSLPLFRYRYGALIAGALVGLVPSVVGLVMFAPGTPSLRTVEGWQLLVAVLGLATFGALAAWIMREAVMRRGDASRDDPPVT